MRIRSAVRALAFSLFFVSASACAVTTPLSGTHCNVTGAKHLPADSGGERALCAELQEAVVSTGLEGVRIEVEVLSPSRVVAVATLKDGRSLSPVHVGVSDRALTARSLRMLAEALASQLKSADR